MTRELDGHAVLDPDVFDGFALIEADAGTGKTWTLANLVLRALIERGQSIDRIAVLTFTNKAAAELRERVLRAVEQLADGLAGGAVSDPFVRAYLPRCDRARDLPRLRRARALFDEAPISTIHGFCQRILAEQSLSLAQPLPPDLREVDAAYVGAAVERWWRQQLVGTDAWSVGLLIATGNTPAVLAECLRRLLPDPGRRLAPSPCDWASFVVDARSAVDQALQAWHDEHADIAAWLQATDGVVRKSYRRDWVGNWLEKIGQWLRHAPAGLLPDGDPLKRGIARLGARGFAELHPDGPAMPFHLPGRIDVLQDVLARGPNARAGLLDALRGPVGERVRARKREERVQSYDDLLGRTRDALLEPVHGEALAGRLRRRYPVMFVDECQDTDPIQWDILRRLHAPTFAAHAGDEQLSLVLVGDPKQSIYAFRNADLFAYLGARREARHRLRLAENQRSSSELIEGLNRLFDRPEAFVLPEIEFRPAKFGARARAQWGAWPKEDDRRALTLVEIRAADGQAESSAAVVERSLDAMASEVVRLLGGAAGEIVPAGGGAGCAPRASDIAVLVRTAADGQAVKAALARRGVGAIEIARSSVFSTLDARELLRVVDAVADPASSAAIRSALLTGLIGRDAAQVDALAADPAAWSRLVECFFDAAQRWRHAGPVAALRRLLFLDHDVPRVLADAAGAERRLTNLSHLFELLGAMPQAREDPLQGRMALARQIESPDEYGSDDAVLRLESDADLVQILTMHKCKGLEFPIVFVPLAWKGRGRGGAREVFVEFHERDPDGDWSTVLLCDARESGDPEIGRMLDAARREAEAEAVRLLYVAATRAELRLYLFWSATGAPGALDRLLGPEPAVRVAQMAADRPEAIAALDASALCSDAVHEAGAAHAHRLASRSFDAVVPAPWGDRSYTGLMRAIQSAQPATGALAISGADTADAGDPLRPDHDERIAALPHEDVGAAAAAGGGTIRHRFPGGATAGTALHGILERADFGRPVPADLVTGELERYGIVADPVAVGRWLDEVLDAPLRTDGGECLDLRAVGEPSMARELEFSLPAVRERSRGRTAGIVAIVQREFPFDGSVSDDHGWHGYLNGFIDLVFEANGRYWLLDWKSNRLGDDDASYGPAAMRAEIARHGYALQFCLYTLALHRLLRWRVPDYDYDAHVGGVFYSFLRGAGAAPGGQGVYFARPSRALVEALDEQFGGTVR